MHFFKFQASEAKPYMSVSLYSLYPVRILASRVSNLKQVL